MKSFEELAAEFTDFSRKTFKGATATDSLKKLMSEAIETAVALERVEYDKLNDGKSFCENELIEEYADCFMCLFDSMMRANISMYELKVAFAAKIEKNKAREWKRNADGTYSHVKSTTSE